MKVVLSAVSLYFFVICCFADNPNQKPYNFFTFSQQKKIINHELDAFTPPDFKSNPDFGILPFDKPSENCIELIDQRTADSRYFIEQGSSGKHFYKQQSYGAINYQDKSGWWREINYRLKPISDLIFEASNQPSTVAVNLEEKFSSIINNDRKIIFNKNIEIYHLDKKGTVESLGIPDWSHFSAGDDGILIRNFYPGIDLQLIVSEGKIESNFILNKHLTFADGWLVAKQQFDLNNLSFSLDETAKDKNNHLHGDITIGDRENEYFRIHTTIAYDSYAHIIQLGNEVRSTNELLTYIPVDWLNDSQTIYPVVIDPLVSSSASLTQASITGSQYNAVCWINGCTYNLSFLTPANCTITDIKFSFGYTALGLCTMADGGFSFNYGACSSPASGVYNSSLPFTGTYSLSNISSFNDFSSCIPAPQCTPYMMNFVMNFYRCNQSIVPGCNSSCIAAASAWTMTIEGHTVEILPGSLTPNQQICEGDTADLYLTAQYGVAPYTYLWTPVGLITDTIHVSPISNTTYQTQVSDACAQTATDSVIVFVIPDNNPGFTVSPAIGCVGQNTTVTGLGAGVSTNYDWLVPGSTNPIVNDNQSFITQFTSTGIYTITLNYTNGVCVFPSQQNDTVVTILVFSINMSLATPGNICVDDTVEFVTTSMNGGASPSYQWFLNSVPIAGATNDTLLISSLFMNDVIEVTMTSSIPCAVPTTVSFSDTITTVTSVTPSVTVTTFPNDTVCVGDTISFTAQPFNGGGLPSYQWQVNGTNTGITTSSFSSSTLNSGDSVSVVLTSTATCAFPANASSSPVEVIIKPYSAPAINISVTPDTVCIGATATFNSVIANGGTNPSYQWVVNGSITGNNSSAFSLSPVLSNTVVTAMMTSNERCLLPNFAISNQIVVNTYPSLNVTSSGSTTTCPKDPVSLFAQATGGNGTGYSYVWSNNAGNDSIVTVNPLVTTNYFVTATDACGSFPVTDSVLVNVLNGPTALFSYNPDDPTSLFPKVSFRDHSTDAISWLWNFGDGDSSVSENPDHVYPAPGIYDVTLVVMNTIGCRDTLLFKIVVKEDVSFFVPNSFSPNGDGKNDTFTPLGTNLGDYELLIYDRWGNEIFNGGPLNPWTGKENGNIAAPDGVYLYKISLKDTRFQQQLVIGRVTLIH